MYKKAEQWIKDAIRYMESYNESLKSVLNDLYEAKEQLKEIKKRNNNGNPSITARSCLISGASLVALAKRHTDGEHSVFILNQPGIRELGDELKKIEKELANPYSMTKP